MPMDDAVNVAFDDEDDAARWIERVCNLFISQRLTVLFRGMETTLKDGGFDKWLQQDEDYVQDYWDLISTKAEKKQTLQKWEELDFKRQWLGFYEFFDDVQLKLKIQPLGNGEEPMTISIIRKNRKSANDDPASSNNYILLYTRKPRNFWATQDFFNKAKITQLTKKFNSIHSTLRVMESEVQNFAIQPDIWPEIDMLCLQAVFHANTCMLNFYSAHKKFLTPHKHVIQIESFPAYDENMRETQMSSEFVQHNFASAIYTMFDTDFYCFKSKRFICISDIDLEIEESFLKFNGGNVNRGHEEIIDLSQVWNDAYDKVISDFPGDDIHAIYTGFKALNQTHLIENTDALICTGWPLKNDVQAALKAGIMCALTAKQTHEFVEIPRSMQWESQRSKTYKCPGWAWWDVLLRLHAEEQLFDTEQARAQYHHDAYSNTNDVDFTWFYRSLRTNGDSLLVDNDNSFSRHGVSHLLLALAEFGPYDTMMFGDASMNLMTLFLSCIVSTIEENMRRNLLTLNSLYSDSNVNELQTWTYEQINTLCDKLLNVLCIEYCSKEASQGDQLKHATWWHTCDIEDVDDEGLDEDGEIVTDQSKIFTKLTDEYRLLFRPNHIDDLATRNILMEIAAAMLMLYDIRSSGAKTKLRTLLDAFGRNVYDSYQTFDQNKNSVSYETMSNEYYMDLQKSINNNFIRYTKSAVGRAMLCFCGCTEHTRQEIFDSMSKDTNINAFIASIRILVERTSHKRTFDEGDEGEGDNIESIESHAKVREMAWDKMVAWRTEKHRKKTIKQQKRRDKSPWNAQLRIPIKRQIELHDALEQNNFDNKIHTMMRQMKTRMTDDIMYQCFMQNCCQVKKTDDEKLMKAGMQLWMPVIIKNSIANLPAHLDWYDYIKQDPTHKSEPRLEIGLHMLTLARAYYEDCAMYDSMLRHRSSIHTRDRVENTIARPNERTREDPVFDIEQRQ